MHAWGEGLMHEVQKEGKRQDLWVEVEGNIVGFGKPKIPKFCQKTA
jgi:hypothetical protein